MPIRPFLYTIDQLSVLLDITEVEIRRNYLYYENRSIGTKRKDLIAARNIAPADAKPEWRVAEKELIRWLKFKGFRYYERGSVY